MNTKRNVNIKFAVDLFGVKRLATTDRFKVIYDGKTPDGTLIVKVTNSMFDVDRFYSDTLSLPRESYGYEMIEHVYDRDIVRFSFKGKDLVGEVVDDRDIRLCYIKAYQDGQIIKVPLYRAESVDTIGSTLLGDDLSDYLGDEIKDKVKEKSPYEPEPTDADDMYVAYVDAKTVDHWGMRYSAGAYIITRFGEVIEEKAFALGDYTNMQAELTAASLAINAILSRNPREIRVRTDCSYVVNGAEKWSDAWIRNDWVNQSGEDVKNVNMWKSLLILKDEGHATLEWSSDMKDLPLHKKVNDMARMAAEGRVPA